MTRQTTSRWQTPICSPDGENKRDRRHADKMSGRGCHSGTPIWTTCHGHPANMSLYNNRTKPTISNNREETQDPFGSRISAATYTSGKVLSWQKTIVPLSLCQTGRAAWRAVHPGSLTGILRLIPDLHHSAIRRGGEIKSTRVESRSTPRPRSVA